MTQQNINIGPQNEKQGDSLFSAFTKTQANFTDLYEQIANLGADNIVVVNSIDDFPEPISGVINLEDDKVYHIGAQIVTENRFQCGANNVFTSGNPFATPLVYTGTGTMFTGTGVSFALDRMVVVCPNAQAFDFTGIGAGETFGLNIAAIAQCLKAGTFNNLRSVNITNSSFFDCSDGITVQGTTNWDTLTINRMRVITSNASAIGIDLDNSVHKTFEILDFVLQGVSGAVGISGLTNSGNIAAGFIGNVLRSEFPSPITPLVGIQPNDIRYNFAGNTNVPDSQNAGDLFLENGPETITVSAASTFYEIGLTSGGANWNGEVQDRFTFNTNGYITYNGERDIDATIIATATVEKAGGGSEVIEMRVATNWSAGQTGLSKSKSQTQNTSPTSITSIALVKLSPGDNIRPIFANNDSTDDVIVDVTSLVVTG